MKTRLLACVRRRSRKSKAWPDGGDRPCFSQARAQPCCSDDASLAWSRRFPSTRIIGAAAIAAMGDLPPKNLRYAHGPFDGMAAQQVSHAPPRRAQGRRLDPRHRFPAPGNAALVPAITVDTAGRLLLSHQLDDAAFTTGYPPYVGPREIVVSEGRDGGWRDHSREQRPDWHIGDEHRIWWIGDTSSTWRTWDNGIPVREERMGHFRDTGLWYPRRAPDGEISLWDALWRRFGSWFGSQPDPRLLPAA